MAIRFDQSCYQRTLSRWKSFTRHLPLGGQRWPMIMRWVSLFVGCLGMAASGSTVTFSFWQNAMRGILNQTETESNIVVTLGNVGSLTAFPAGMLYESFGAQLDVILGCIIASAAYILLYLGTSTWADFFSNNNWLVDAIYFFVGFGCIFIYMGSLLPNVENFPFHQRGKVIGLLDAALSVGPTLLSVLYNTAYTNGFTAEGEEGKQNLPGFFLTMCFLFVIISLALVFVSGRLRTVSGETLDPFKSGAYNESTPLMSMEESAGDDAETEAITGRSGRSCRTSNTASTEFKLEDRPPNQYSEFPFEEMPVSKVIRRWNFHFLLWQFVFAACTQTTFQVNISTYLRSFGMAEHNLLFTVLNTALQAITKLIAGIFSDMIARKGKMPRAVLFLLPYGLQTVALFLSVFYGDQFIVLLLTCIFVGAAFGATWCQTPILVGELFGSKYLGSNWGWSMLLTAALGFPFSISFSKIYEAAIYEPGEIYCYGLQCFSWSFAMLTGTSLCALIFAIGLTQNMRRNASDRQRFLNQFQQQDG